MSAIRIVIINLKRSKERRAHMEAQMRAQGLAHSFLDAVDGYADADAGAGHYDEARCRRFWGAELGPGEVGCFASHYRAWQASAESGDTLVVFEDDAVICEDFAKVMKEAGEAARRHGFVTLMGIFETGYRVVAPLSGGRSLVRLDRGPLGATGYVVGPAGAARLIAAAEHWVEPLDHYLAASWRHGLEQMAVMPYPVVNLPALETTIARSIPRRTTVAAKLTREFHRLRTSLGRTWWNLRYRIRAG